MECPGLADAMALASARARLLEFEAQEKAAEATMAHVLDGEALRKQCRGGTYGFAESHCH